MYVFVFVNRFSRLMLFIMVLQCINPTASCLVVHRAGEISVWSYETDRRNVGYVRYHDGYCDPL